MSYNQLIQPYKEARYLYPPNSADDCRPCMGKLCMPPISPCPPISRPGPLPIPPLNAEPYCIQPPCGQCCFAEKCEVECCEKKCCKKKCCKKKCCKKKCCKKKCCENECFKKECVNVCCKPLPPAPPICFPTCPPPEPGDPCSKPWMKYWPWLMRSWDSGLYHSN